MAVLAPPPAPPRVVPGDDELALEARGWRAIDLLELGRVTEATAELTAHAGMAARPGRARNRYDALAWAGMRALLEGRVDEARAAAGEAMVLGTSIGEPESTDSFRIQRWATALEWGTPGEVSEVIDAYREHGAAVDLNGRRASLALLLVRAGHLDLAAEEMRRVTDHGLGRLRRDPGRLLPLACLAEVAWTLGDVARASLTASLLEPFAGRLIVAGRGVACMGSVARACGLAAARTHRWDDVERHFADALEVHRRVGALPLLARTQYQWFQVLTERGRRADRRRAAEALRMSGDLAARLGMDQLLR